MNLIFTILIDGLTYASWLFIVALGLTLVFGVLKILNVAHGSFYALGAYAAATLVGWFASMQLAPELSLIAMLLAAVAVAALIAPLCERGLLRVFYGRDEVLLVLVTFALFLIMEDATKLIWGVNPLYVSEPYMLFGVVEMGPQSYVGYDFMLVAVAAIVGYVVWWGLNRTRIGKIVGVSVGVIIVSFAVVIIGGLGSIPGAAIGALIVGIARSAAVHVWPVAELFSIYVVMAIVLMFRPEGLFQRIQARKI